MNKFLMGVVIIPLSLKSSWNLEVYSKIPSNLVSFSSSGMNVKVKSSASPLIYSFDKPKIINQFEISGEFKGLPKFSPSTLVLQGSKGYDDYPLRVGLILKGEKNLSSFQKIFAPKWIKNLYSNIPSGFGLDYIQFYNITQNSEQLGKSRVHPASELIHETFFALVKESGKFNYIIKLDSPKSVLGMWIGIDGDDTHSDYDVDISKIELIE